MSQGSRSLRGKGVLLTGASRGIGKALAHALAREGARLVLAARSEDDLAAVAKELPSGVDVHTLVADLRSESERSALVARAQQAVGGIEVLINNAGEGLYGAVEDLNSQALRDVFELNLVAPAHLAGLVLPAMRERRRGHIVMVSSVLGERAIPLAGGYCASKFALEGLAQSLRAEVSDVGIHVLVVRPGRTESAFRASAPTTGFRPRDRFRPMAAERVAQGTVRALLRGKSRIDFTGAGKMMMWAERVSPALVDLAMKRLYARMRAD